MFGKRWGDPNAARPPGMQMTPADTPLGGGCKDLRGSHDLLLVLVRLGPVDPWLPLQPSL